MILYHASSSYYSMIARLALAAARVSFQGRRMDIHLAKEQLADWYIKINPHMTVPSLADDTKVLSDSRDILAFAAQQAGSLWANQDAGLAPQIEKVVDAHYQIPIERLTFGKGLASIPPLRIVVPRMLRGIIKKLENELPSAPDPQAINEKIKLNRARLAYFTEGDLRDHLNLERQHVTKFLEGLTTKSEMLFGDRWSSADVVTAVLLGRLKMIGEYGLVKPGAELDQWFIRVQQTDAFKQSDIWTRFQPWRILLKT